MYVYIYMHTRIHGMCITQYDGDSHVTVMILCYCLPAAHTVMQAKPHLHHKKTLSAAHSDRTCLERWGAGVEYHFQEFNEPYAPS